MLSHYATLGVPQNATKEQIKKAYRKLSLRWHPDMPNGNAGKYMQIKEAYDALIAFDPNRTHTQYQHRRRPSVHFNSTRLDKDGNCIINVTFSNIGFIIGRAHEYGYQNWDTFGLHRGILQIDKKDLIRGNYEFSLDFYPIIGSCMSYIIKMPDPRTKFQKVVHRIKRFFIWDL